MKIFRNFFFTTLNHVFQSVLAAPQILYQRPYDPVVLPAQNQRLVLAQNPSVRLSQPSYASARAAPATSAGNRLGPNMFRHALVRVRSFRFTINSISSNSCHYFLS